MLAVEEPTTAAAHFALLVLGRALDKSLFTPEQPFSDRQLKGQADAGVAAFHACYGIPR